MERIYRAQYTRDVQKVRRLIDMSIINVTDTVSLVSTNRRYDVAQLIIRLHLTTDAAYCYRRSSVACLSVCHNLEPCKTAELIEMPFAMWTQGTMY